MKLWLKNGQTSVILRVRILDTTSVIGAGKTGLTFNSAGLIISTIADNEASATTYTQAGGTIETITTLGTFAAPTASKCRFKEVDATNHPGLYEIQIANARWAVSGAKSVIVSLPPVSGLGTSQVCAEMLLTAIDPQDSMRAGIFALPNALANGTGGLVGDVLLGGTASAGGANTITLAGGVATDDFYKYSVVRIISGTGAGQAARLIIAYSGTSKLAYVNKAWTTAPDNTSVFVVLPWTVPSVVHSGVAQGGGASTITLQATASSTDDIFKGSLITIFSGTGAGESRIASAYNGTSKVLTVDDPWTVQPDATSVYEIAAAGRAWADVYKWNGAAVPTPNTSGVPKVDSTLIEGQDATDQIRDAAITALTNRGYTDTRAGLLDHLDQNISANNTAITEIAGDTDTIISNQSTVDGHVLDIPTNPLRTNDSRLDYLDASVTGIATSILNAIAALDIPTVDELVNGVLDVAAADHNLPNTIGEKINSGGGSGGSGADPLLNEVPGDYEAGTAGYNLGLLPAIKAKTDTGIVNVSEGVDPDTGATILVRGSSYKKNDSRSLIYTINGYPDFHVGDPAYWRAMSTAQKVVRITGAVIAVNQVEFEFEPEDSAKLLDGSFSLALDSAMGNLLKTADQTLTIRSST